MVFGEDFRHAEEISCGIFDVCRSFDEEIVDYLGRGNRSLYRIDKISRLVTSIILNNINNMSHPRFHKTKLHQKGKLEGGVLFVRGSDRL